jgi:hypothetical protein
MYQRFNLSQRLKYYKIGVFVHLITTWMILSIEDIQNLKVSMLPRVPAIIITEKKES